MESPRFAVDRMLGRLARWLRLLGFDAAYRPDLPGRRLVTLAAREGRLALTRDASLARVGARAEILLLRSDRFREQLRELDCVHRLAPDPARAPRCGVCNGVLESLPLERIPASVPEYVRATQSDFQRCAVCRRIYWRATHWARLREEISTMGLRAA